MRNYEIIKSKVDNYCNSKTIFFLNDKKSSKKKVYDFLRKSEPNEVVVSYEYKPISDSLMYSEIKVFEKVVD